MKCKVSWCEEEVYKKGYCNRHYLQMRRHGKILPIKRNCNLPQEFEFDNENCYIKLHDTLGELIAKAIIDLSDYDLIKDYKFYFQGRRYVKVSGIAGKNIFLHQLIMGRKWVDHIDGNPLNNKRNNLRPCNNQQNQFNQKPQTGRASKYKGVRVANKPRPYYARICFNGREIHLGSFYTEEEAALTYNEAAIKYFGVFAHLNKLQ
ncbi:MAG: AP2/ERF family transcription factor [Phycisphaerae bacterium]|jgi:hypothetical protein